MRLRELHLARFGHFTDRRFDFGAVDGRPDFHVIHGLNEAGKTTTMEAALRLLFGFPNRERYAFKHQRANLSVSAILETADGVRNFTRLPTARRFAGGRSGQGVAGIGAGHAPGRAYGRRLPQSPLPGRRHDRARRGRDRTGAR